MVMYNNIIISQTALDRIENNNKPKDYPSQYYLSTATIDDSDDLYHPGDTVFYLIDSTYMKVNGTFTQRYYVRIKLNNISDLMNYLVNQNRYSSNVPAGIIQAILLDKSVNIKPKIMSGKTDHSYVAMYGDFDASQIDINDFNVDAFLNMPIPISVKVVEYFEDYEQRKKLICMLIEKNVHVKMTDQQVTSIYNMLDTYFTEKYGKIEKDNTEMTEFIQLIETQLNSKTKTAGRIMTDIFRPCTYNEEYYNHNHYMLNTYFIHYPETYAVKELIRRNLKHVTNFRELNIKEFTNYSAFGDIVSLFKTITKHQEISIIISRIYKATEENVGITHDIINLIISSIELDDLKKNNNGLIAKAFVDNFNVMSGYGRYNSLQELLTKSENMDYIAETIVDELITRRNMRHLLDNLYDYCNKDTDPYIFKALKNAIENSEHKKIKKYLFKRGV